MMKPSLDYIERTRWGRKSIAFDLLEITRPSFMYITTKYGLKAVGGFTGYGIGALTGMIMERIPYVNDILVQIIQNASGINISGELAGIFGLLGIVYGAAKSGLKLDRKDLEINEVDVFPVGFKLRKRKEF